MKMIAKENANGRNIITVEQKFLLWKRIRKFEAMREFPPGYWDWLELPNMKRTSLKLSFQLDSWNKL